MQKNNSQFRFNLIKDVASLNPLKVAWRKSLTAPQDDMWESFTDIAEHWEIKSDTQLIGYACVNTDNQLLQFYILPNWMQDSRKVFKKFIKEQKITIAVIGSNNPLFLSIAMHFQNSVKVDSYLFTDFINKDIIDKEGVLRSAGANDLEKAVNFYHNGLGAPKDWLNKYIGNLIEGGEFFVLENEDEILGTCEVRRSKSNIEIANVGMIVSPDHRKKGLGTYLLGRAKEIAIQWGRQPICSCEKENIGSIKSIENNGFRSVHQMLLMEF